jgi:hypothetical protein
MEVLLSRASTISCSMPRRGSTSLLIGVRRQCCLRSECGETRLALAKIQPRVSYARDCNVHVRIEQ